jgi:hypothetical protein
MIPAAVLMCALSAAECQSDDARAISAGIDSATQDDGLRAHLVVYSHEESHWQLAPACWSWDCRKHLARGPWQLWGPAGRADLSTQARSWLHNVQASSLASVDSSPSRARRRAAMAERLVSEAR